MRLIQIILCPFLISLCACSPEQTATKSDSLSCTSNSANSSNELPESISYKIVARYPHRQNAFSQGLVFHQGYLYESTGLYGESSLAKIDLSSGEVLNAKSLDNAYFGEGLTLLNNQFIQLTWKSGKVMRYNGNDLTLIKSNTTINGEGWGLTHNGQELISSDGSATLHWRNADTLEILKSAQIRYGTRPLKNINELEWVNGCILANIWRSDIVVVINPATMQVEYTLDLSPLARPELLNNKAHVANGIAYRQDNDHLLVTGKNWRYLYELKLLLN